MVIKNNYLTGQWYRAFSSKEKAMAYFESQRFQADSACLTSVILDEDRMVSSAMLDTTSVKVGVMDNQV